MISSKKSLTKTNKITISGISIAMYIIIMYFTQSFAFMQIQVRLATSLYALAAIFPFLIVPMGIANFLSNTLMGGLGLPDMIGGAIAGMITSALIYLISRYKLNDWLIIIPLISVPGLLVPLWLSYILHVPYLMLVLSVSAGQVIPAVLGVLLVKEFRKFY